MGVPYSCLYASSIYVTYGWLEFRHPRPAVFSSIYIIGQLYLSRTVHSTKNLAHLFILPSQMTLNQSALFLYCLVMLCKSLFRYDIGYDVCRSQAFRFRVSKDERELKKFGTSPFLGLNLVPENLDGNGSRKIRCGDKIYVVRQRKEPEEVGLNFRFLLPRHQTNYRLGKLY